VTTRSSTRHGESGSVKASAIEIPPRNPAQVSTAVSRALLRRLSRVKRHGDADQTGDDGKRHRKSDRQEVDRLDDQGKKLQVDEQE